MLVLDKLDLNREDLVALTAAAVILVQSGKITLQQFANYLHEINRYEREDANGV